MFLIRAEYIPKSQYVANILTFFLNIKILSADFIDYDVKT